MFTHAFFGDEGLIMGYKRANIDLYVEEETLNSFIKEDIEVAN